MGGPRFRKGPRASRITRPKLAVMKRALAWVKKLKPYRVYEAYSLAGGNLSAAGMSFQSFFAVFAAVWVGFSISGIYLNDHPTVKDAVIKFINLQIPNFISTGGAIDPALLSSMTFGWTGSLALLVLAYTAINWIEYTRVAMHRMFGLPRPTFNFVLLKLWDFVLAVFYGVVIFAGATITVFATSLFKDVLKWMGLESNVQAWIEYCVRSLVILIVFIIDAVMLALMIRVLSGVPIPYRYLWRGAALGGLALGIMKVLGSTLLGGATKNPLFATFAIFIAILIWFNLMCRVYLLTAEWIATSMRDDSIEPTDAGWVLPRGGFNKRFGRR